MNFALSVVRVSLRRKDVPQRPYGSFSSVPSASKSATGHGELRGFAAIRILGSASGRAARLSAGGPSSVPRRGVTGVVFAELESEDPPLPLSDSCPSTGPSVREHRQV